MQYIEKTETFIDNSTGEVLSQQTKVINVRPLEPEPDYIKLYIGDLGRLNSLAPASTEILLYIAASVDYDGFVSLTAHKKARIALTCGCSPKTIKNAIIEYVKLGLLIRVGRAEYELNPHVFAKGKWRAIRERRKKFMAKIIYGGAEGRTIETEVIDEPAVTD